MATARTSRFAHDCVTSPHHLASTAGAQVLADGGNAVDAAVAANLVLAVVTPYHCGPGGDLLALVWDGEVHAYRSVGRAPAAVSLDEVRRAAGGHEMPDRGPHSVTVPGAVHGWFDLLERFGTRSFGEVARPAIALATGGFVVSAHGAELLRAGRDSAVYAGWGDVYGDAEAGRRLRLPGLARTLTTLAEEGPEAFYGGPIGADAVTRVRGLGGALDLDDLRDHRPAWVQPLRAPFRDLEIVEHPPPTQGVTALEALRIVDELGALPPPGTAGRVHLLIEAVKVALADRDRHVGDPDAMSTTPAALLSDEHVRAAAGSIDPSAALRPTPRAADTGGTAYLAAADADGLLVSLIQSNYRGFGSGITVPEWGLNLHDRGAGFSLDPTAVNALAPRRLPRHTLIPALALRDGRPVLVFGTMGGDGQAQTHLQLLDRLTDPEVDDDLGALLDAPRWYVSPTDGSVAVEPRDWLADAVAGLRERRHEVRHVAPYDHLLGHAHAISVGGDGYVAATDPRTEGGVAGR